MDELGLGQSVISRKGLDTLCMHYLAQTGGATKIHVELPLDQTLHWRLRTRNFPM